MGSPGFTFFQVSLKLALFDSGAIAKRLCNGSQMRVCRTGSSDDMTEF